MSLSGGLIAFVALAYMATLFTIAFYGVVDPGSGQEMPIVDIMTGQIIAKLTLVVVFVPILITACVKLGQRLDGKTA